MDKGLTRFPVPSLEVTPAEGPASGGTRSCKSLFIAGIVTLPILKAPCSWGRLIGFARAEWESGGGVPPLVPLWDEALRNGRGPNRPGSAGDTHYQCAWYSISCIDDTQSHGRANLPVSRGGSDRFPSSHTPSCLRVFVLSCPPSRPGDIGTPQIGAAGFSDDQLGGQGHGP